MRDPLRRLAYAIDMNEEAAEKLRRLAYRELLLEEGLVAEVGLEDLPERFAELLDCGSEESLDRLLSVPLLDLVELNDLRRVLTIRDMNLVSCTAAGVSAELKGEGVTYERCCRLALCYIAIGRPSHVFSALRVAATKNDLFARHHYLYGLALGLEGSVERACWELGMALSYEPYDEARERIQLALELLEEA